MLVEKPLGGAAPTEWFVVFQRASSWAWLDRLVPGEFKHVLAIGWVPHSGTWLWFNPTMSGLVSLVLVDGLPAWEMINREFEGAKVVRMLGRLPTRDDPARWPLGAWCVPLVANVVNVRSGAVTPTGLLRDCLAIPGSTVVSDEGFDASGRPAREGAEGSG